ncbi:hypothetical protein DPMN_010121 [Dreissena polymorpha]|uniref:Uncharacterized protein n=1 Tax=Dreissena polymorpha TaxID=45954 RepID=A0A9D4N1L0_DREPO|nr:hypothetical protein DPMN_010121 [Dreissena polymorpha]
MAAMFFYQSDFQLNHWTKNVTSRVENCPAPGSHVCTPIWTIFELVRDINETNVLNRFHDDWAKFVTSRVFTRNTAPPPDGHLHEDWASNVTSTVFTSFELSRGINRTNVLTKFHEDRTINVASRVFTRQNVDDAQRTKACRAKLHEDWASNVTSTVFTSRGINRTNVLTNFHEDRTIYVASRVFTGQNVDDERQQTADKR